MLKKSPKSIKTLEKEFKNNPDYKPFISSIVFPNYKNLTEGSEITFDFPLTLLIGKNGTNKSSVLHAIYGCPDQSNIADYWFSTHTDPINPEDEEGKRPAIFYRYQIPKTGAIAEVLKLRIAKPNDPDYWEPSRPTVDRGMKEIEEIKNNKPLPEGRSKTRWNAIKKAVLYLDFRAEISAFDKAFYKVNKSESRQKHRERLRKRSKPLKIAIENEQQSRVYKTKQRIFKNYTFTEKQIDIANHILGTEYKKIIYLEHDFYYSLSFSIYLQKGDNKQYSEAIAGSGETSVIRLIYALDNAKNKSLILLDEPETSLHIEAQRLLRDYILQMIGEKKLQVVISTHSPFFAKGLPDCAIKNLTIDDNTKKVTIGNFTPAEQSSFHLGYERNNAAKVNIYVEDILAQSIVQYVINSSLFQARERDQMVVHHYISGETGLLQLAVSEALKQQSNVAFLFDGDANPCFKNQDLEEIPNPLDIPVSQNSRLKGMIESTFGSCPKFPRDSNKPLQEFENYKKYLTFARTRFRYLPFKNPEEFIVQNSDLKNRQDNSDPKKCIKNYTEEMFGSSRVGDLTSDEIFYMQRMLLAKIPSYNEDLKKIADILKTYLGDSSLASSI